MTYENFDKAKELKNKIEQTYDFLKSYKKSKKIEIKSVPENDFCKGFSFLVDEEHHQEVIDMVTKWLNDYRKRFKAL